ncbi:pyrroline-5-carboxylate reductase [Bacillus luteolus]|uniref:Pyrroline-5-carboxylate reductase n=1 Tax=Litchfieldia luteola TaxID=682179 RepID=A0ABR9QEE2_9BACI|nr:pyrroline-5-carboxylate reductase [Cytobacillus luteolus]MBE4906861.1 pyrroline-5-carboxylate reductase [Cytobacillus luteolus]MBP1940484.1 pyrroline-5-carboxylate reductase [Cytobacillus luteolus]
MSKTIGFIGCGKMAQAMIEGMIRSGLVKPDQIMASAKTESTLQHASSEFGIQVTTDNVEVARSANFLFLAVKPNLYGEIIEEIKHEVQPNTIVITIAAGISLDYMEKAFERDIKVVRSMPNTPSLVGEGMSTLCKNNKVTDEDIVEVIALFESFGKAEVMEEKLMDAIPAVSGSSPAYVYLFIEALADGAVLQGIPRDKAYRLAAQAVLGAAKMVLETGQHPGELKDAVCTPGGATIEAIATLEKNKFRGTILSAMESCTNKSKALSGK